VVGVLPKRLKRVQMFEAGPAHEVAPGLFSIEGHYAVRPLEQFFEPTGLYTPSDWADAPDPDAPTVTEAAPAPPVVGPPEDRADSASEAPLRWNGSAGE
jgi:hypothetical protein